MPTTDLDQQFMRLALDEARLAAEMGEVPIGALITYKNKILCRSHNLTETLTDASSHAEVLAIREASRRLQNWRLADCVLYITLEPCPMCAGLIRLSRLPKIVFAAFDERAGAFGSQFALQAGNLWGPEPEVVSGVLAEESQTLVKDFFRSRRKKEQV